MASSEGDIGLVRYLVEKYPDTIEMRGGTDSMTPLHLASLAGELDVVVFLAKECGVDVERFGGFGKGRFIMPHPEVIKMLLSFL